MHPEEATHGKTTPQPTKHPDPKHPSNTPTRQPVNQPAGSAQRQCASGADPSKGKDPGQPSGLDPNYNTKPAPNEDGSGAGGDQSAHPSPATDPTNAAPEPAQWTKESTWRPPLPKGRDYVAGQPVTQEEYELTEKEQAERVRPEAWERLEGQGVQIRRRHEGRLCRLVPRQGRDSSRTRRPLRNPRTGTTT